MTRATLERLLRQLRNLHEALEQSIKAIEDGLGSWEESGVSASKGRHKMLPQPSPPDAESLRAEWQRLRDGMRESSDPEAELRRFIEGKSKSELRAFLHANALPIASKTSKQEMVRQLVQIVKVANTITGETGRRTDNLENGSLPQIGVQGYKEPSR